ncbi:holo-ACP synthase [Clostridium thermarum]|uniref:holo-ACP synthase n=1 Tax=Clostridium thermarum TaxID=1716543 RepID=UPI001121BD18|nr:holo-ACP synthase [Clostridium thermarum]
MIAGVGIDIIEIDRIEAAIKKNNNFINKVFCDSEIEYIVGKKVGAQHAAGMFSAKEAVSKALGTGISGFSLKDIEINRDDKGKPFVKLRGGAKDIAESFGAYKIHLSISHGRDNAVAYAVLEINNE